MRWLPAHPSVFERNDHHNARPVANCSRRMTLAGQVLRKNSLTGSEAMQRTVAQTDLDTARESDDVLAARRVVPIDEGARRHPREDHAGRRLQRRLLGELSR